EEGAQEEAPLEGSAVRSPQVIAPAFRPPTCGLRTAVCGLARGARQVYEARDQRAAEVVPGPDLVASALALGLDVEVHLAHVLAIGAVVEPVLDRRGVHLRVELDAPGALAHAVGLGARRADREHHGVVRRGDRIAVPLERREARRGAREERI